MDQILKAYQCFKRLKSLIYDRSAYIISTHFVYLFISNISEIAIDILKCDNDWLFAWFADLRANFFCFRIAFRTEMVLKLFICYLYNV